ncbi:MAG: hypothetical protein EXR75_16100 [Myxococcales bacterium]|nr:hypothetical protein [Myxococcales bacterium]
MNRKVILVAGAALALGLGSMAACVVEVVDDLGSGGSGGSGGAYATVGVGGSGQGGAGQGGGAAACVTCGDWVTACASDAGCDTLVVCQGTSEDLAAALGDCICTECADAAECGPTCDDPTDACGTCQGAAATAACKADFDACANDT